jgi:agmatinase
VSPTIDPLPIGRPSFLNAPRCTSLDLLDADVAVIGCPFTTPVSIEQSRAPSSEAPAAVREQSLRFADTLDRYDFEFGGALMAGRRMQIVDCGDVWAVPGQYADNSRVATQAVEVLRDTGALPLILGGDHAASLLALRAYARPERLCVVHLGADLDFRDEVNGVRDGPRSAMRRASELPWIASLMHVGLRSSGETLPGDVEAATAFGSVQVLAEELHDLGVSAVLERLPAADGYFVSLDLDGVDPAIAPGVAMPKFGGLTYFEATNVLKGIAARGRVVGASLVGIVPAHDLHGMTSLLGVRLMLTLIGAIARTTGARLDSQLVTSTSRGG